MKKVTPKKARSWISYYSCLQREMKMSMWVQHIKDKIGSMAKEKRILKCSKVRVLVCVRFSDLIKFKEEMIVGKMLQIFPWIYFQASLSSMIQKVSSNMHHSFFFPFFRHFQSFERLIVIFPVLLVYFVCLLSSLLRLNTRNDFLFEVLESLHSFLRTLFEQTLSQIRISVFFSLQILKVILCPPRPRRKILNEICIRRVSVNSKSVLMSKAFIVLPHRAYALNPTILNSEGRSVNASKS
eukprot:TRINITY_DN2727_c0_g1_i9.p1 TRINITY_DN2727_c0_g1~~TRINITY_DN2727_c0_g1_i9.p1  ORF type:complete len:240 (+),score=-15.11 TRINITY_DN2727_c0_g1_i9:98-817(+)